MSEENPGYIRDWPTRNRVQRQEVRDIKAEIAGLLDASRPTPDQLRRWIARLEAISSNTQDNRAAHHAAKTLMDLYKWQTEYEQPKATKVEHSGEVGARVIYYPEKREEGAPVGGGPKAVGGVPCENTGVENEGAEGDV